MARSIRWKYSVQFTFGYLQRKLPTTCCLNEGRYIRIGRQFLTFLIIELPEIISLFLGALVNFLFLLCTTPSGLVLTYCRYMEASTQSLTSGYVPSDSRVSVQLPICRMQASPLPDEQRPFQLHCPCRAIHQSNNQSALVGCTSFR